MNFLKSFAGACVSGLGVFAAGLASWLIGWGFFWGIGAAVLALIITHLVARANSK
jgi:hypothetical protein